MSNSLTHSTQFLIAYETMGNILNNLLDSPILIENEDILKNVDRAILLHQQLHADFNPLIEEQRKLKTKLSELTREPGEIIGGKNPIRIESPNFIKQRELIENENLSPIEACKTATANGIDDYIEILRLLRTVFNCSLKEAQEIVDQAKKK